MCEKMFTEKANFREKMLIIPERKQHNIGIHFIVYFVKILRFMHLLKMLLQKSWITEYIGTFFRILDKI